MIPLYEYSCFAFRFADARLIPRIHLEGIGVERRVSVFKIDAVTSERLGVLGKAIVGGGGWRRITSRPITFTRFLSPITMRRNVGKD